MTRLLRGLRERGGWPLGLTALGAAAGLLCTLWLAPRWQAEADDVHRQLLALQLQLQLQAQAQARAQADAAAVPWPAGASDAGSAVAELPPRTAAPERMAELLALALRHGVAIEHAQGRDAPGTADRADHVAVTMPVRATYADLRRYVADALRADPALALERLRLHRDTTQATELQGELHWLMAHRLPRRPTP